MWRVEPGFMASQNSYMKMLKNIARMITLQQKDMQEHRETHKQIISGSTQHANRKTTNIFH